MPKTNERFHAKYDVDAHTGCWLWNAAKNHNGYGSFWSGAYRFHNPKRSPIMVLAHRWSYEHHVGAIDDGLYVLHSCDTPACVNPDHLSVDTQAENMHDSATKGRYLWVSPEAKAEIRRRFTGHHGQQTELAQEYGVNKSTIAYILGRGKYARRGQP